MCRWQNLHFQVNCFFKDSAGHFLRTLIACHICLLSFLLNLTIWLIVTQQNKAEAYLLCLNKMLWLAISNTSFVRNAEVEWSQIRPVATGKALNQVFYWDFPFVSDRGLPNCKPMTQEAPLIHAVPHGSRSWSSV